MNAFLNRFFKLKANGTDTKTEIIAGITTFMTMVYIVPLNGIIMSQAGMPMPAVITATAIITILATVANGLWSNTPIAMSVGLGLNSYFVYALVLGQGLAWQTVLGIVFLSGVLFLVLTVTNIRRYLISSITPQFKLAISGGIGAFIAFIGLKQMGIITSNPATYVALGNLKDPNVLLGIIGLLIVFALVIWKVKGAFIIAIAVTSVIGYIIGVGKAPDAIISMPASISPIFMKLDVMSALKISLIAPVITFMLTDLFDSLGTLSGVGYRAGIFKDKDTTAIQKTLEVDAVATVAGSLFGLSTTTSFIESASGVEEGGKTGLTAVVTGLLFALTLFLLPIFKCIPANAIYPLLVMVGVFMCAELMKLDFSDYEVSIPTFLIVLMMPMTFSITKGLAFGFISYTFIKLIKGKYRDLNVVLVIMAIVSIIALLVD